MSTEPDPETIIDAHAKLIGIVTIMWNDVHDLVYHTFEDLSGLPKPMAKALFHTLRSDASQRELTLAAAQVSLGVDNERFKALKLIFNKIGPLARTRNEAIHTSWGIEFLVSLDLEDAKVGVIGKRPRHTDDGQFTARFQKLRADLQAVFEELHDWQKPSRETGP